MPELQGLQYSTKNVRTPIAALVTLLTLVGAGTGYLIHKNIISNRWETNTEDSFKSAGSNLEKSVPIQATNSSTFINMWSKHDIAIWEAYHLWDDSKFPSMVSAVDSIRKYNPDEMFFGRIPIMSLWASDKDAAAGSWQKARWDALSPYLTVTTDTFSSQNGRYNVNILDEACRIAIVNLLVQYVNNSSNGTKVVSKGGIGVLWTDINVPVDTLEAGTWKDHISVDATYDSELLAAAYKDIVSRTRAALPNLIQIGEGRFAFTSMRPGLDGINLKYFPSNYFGTSPSRTTKDFGSAFSPIDSTSIQVRKETFSKDLGGPYIIIDNRDLRFNTGNNSIVNIAPNLLAAASIIDGVFATIPTNTVGTGNLFEDGYYYPPREFELGRPIDPIITTRYIGNFMPTLYRAFEHGTLLLTVSSDNTIFYSWTKNGVVQNPNLHVVTEVVDPPRLNEGSFVATDSCLDRTTSGHFDPPSYQGIYYSFVADQSVDHFLQFKVGKRGTWLPEDIVTQTDNWINSATPTYSGWMNISSPRLNLFTSPYPGGCPEAQGDSIYVRIKLRNTNSKLTSDWQPTTDGILVKVTNTFSYSDVTPPSVSVKSLTCSVGYATSFFIAANDIDTRGCSFRFGWATTSTLSSLPAEPTVNDGRRWSDWTDELHGRYFSAYEFRYDANSYWPDLPALEPNTKFGAYVQVKDPSGNSTATIVESFETDDDGLCASPAPTFPPPTTSSGSISLSRIPPTGSRNAITDTTTLDVTLIFDHPCYVLVQEAITGGPYPDPTYYPLHTGAVSTPAITDTQFTAQSYILGTSPKILMTRIGYSAFSDTHVIRLKRTNDLSGMVDGSIYKARFYWENKERTSVSSVINITVPDTLPDVTAPYFDLKSITFYCKEGDSSGTILVYNGKEGSTVEPVEDYYSFLQVKDHNELDSAFSPEYHGIDDANWTAVSSSTYPYALSDTATCVPGISCSTPPEIIDVRYRIKDAAGNATSWTTASIDAGTVQGAINSTATISDIGQEPSISIVQDTKYSDISTLTMWKFSSTAPWMAPTVNTAWDTVKNATGTSYPSGPPWSAGPNLTFIPNAKVNSVNDDFDFRFDDTQSVGSKIVSLVDQTATYQSAISSSGTENSNYGLYTAPFETNKEKVRCFQGDTLFVRTKIRNNATGIVSTAWKLDTMIVNIPLKVRGAITIDGISYPAINGPFTWTNDGYLTACSAWSAISKNYFGRTNWELANIPLVDFTSKYINWKIAAKNDISSPANGYIATPGTFEYLDIPNFRNYVDQVRTINTDHIPLWHFNFGWVDAQHAKTYIADNDIYCPGNIDLEIYKIVKDNLAFTRNYYKAGLGNLPSATDTSRHYPEQKIDYLNQGRFGYSDGRSIFSARGDTAFQNYTSKEVFWNLIGADAFDGHVAAGYGDDYYYNPTKGAAFRDTLAETIIKLLSHSYNWRLGTGIIFDYINADGGVQDWDTTNLFPDFDGNGVSCYWDRIEQHRLAYAIKDFMTKLRTYATLYGNPNFIVVANGISETKPDQLMPGTVIGDTLKTLRSSDATYNNFSLFNNFGTNGILIESPPLIHTISTPDTGLFDSGRHLYTQLTANTKNTFRDYLDSRRTQFAYAKKMIQKNSIFEKSFSGAADSIHLFVKTGITGLPTISIFEYSDAGPTSTYRWFDTDASGTFTDYDLPATILPSQAIGEIFAKLYDTKDSPVFMMLSNPLDLNAWANTSYRTVSSRSIPERILGVSVTDWPFTDSRMPEFMGGKELNLGSPVADFTRKAAVSPSVADTIVRVFENGYIKLVWKNIYAAASADVDYVTNNSAINGPYTARYYRDGFPTRGYAVADTSLPFQFIAIKTSGTLPDTLRRSNGWPRKELVPTFSNIVPVCTGATTTHYPQFTVTAAASKSSRMFVQVKNSTTEIWEPAYTNTHDANWSTASLTPTKSITTTLNSNYALAGNTWNVRVRFLTGNIDEGYLSNWITASDVMLASNGTYTGTLTSATVTTTFSSTVDSISTVFASSSAAKVLTQYRLGATGSWLPQVDNNDIYGNSRWTATAATSITDNISTRGSSAGGYLTDIYYRYRIMGTNNIASDWQYTVGPKATPITAVYNITYAPSGSLIGSYVFTCYNGSYRVSASSISNIASRLVCKVSNIRNPTGDERYIDATLSTAQTGSTVYVGTGMTCPAQGAPPENVTLVFSLVNAAGLSTTLGTFVEVYQPAAAPVVISSVAAGCKINSISSFSITGSGFLDSKGTGKVELCNSPVYSSATVKTTQTTSAWSATAITATVSTTGFATSDADGYIFVTANNGLINPQGYYVKLGKTTIISGPTSVYNTKSITLTGAAFGNAINANTSLYAGNAATWAGCTTTSVATIVSWSNNSITATFNTGSLTPSGYVYLYVVNTEGCRSAAFRTIFTTSTSRSITSITSANDTITIIGVGFGVGPDVLVYDRFENGTVEEDVDATEAWKGSGSWTALGYDHGGGNVQYSTYTAGTSHSGNMSLKTMPYSTTTAFGNMAITLPVGQKFYIDFWNKLNLGTAAETNNDQVYGRMSISSAPSPTLELTAPFIYSDLSPVVSLTGNHYYGSIVYRQAEASHITYYSPYPGILDPYNEWNHYRQFYKQSSAVNATDGSYNANIGNAVMANITDVSTFANVGEQWTNCTPFYRFGALVDTANVRSWLDDLYVSTGWSRVEAVSKDRASRNILYPVSWNDTQIKAILEPGTWSSGDTVSVLVWNDVDSTSYYDIRIKGNYPDLTNFSATDACVSASHNITLSATRSVSAAVFSQWSTDNITWYPTYSGPTDSDWSAAGIGAYSITIDTDLACTTAGTLYWRMKSKSDNSHISNWFAVQTLVYSDVDIPVATFASLNFDCGSALLTDALRLNLNLIASKDVYAKLIITDVSEYTDDAPEAVLYNWTKPTSGTAPKTYTVEHSANNAAWDSIASVTDTTYVLSAARADTHRIRVAGIDSLGRQADYSIESISYSPPNAGETDLGWSVDYRTAGTFTFNTEILCSIGHSYFVDYQLKDRTGNLSAVTRLDTIGTAENQPIITGINIATDNTSVTLTGTNLGTGSSVLFYDTFVNHPVGSPLNGNYAIFPNLSSGGISYAYNLSAQTGALYNRAVDNHSNIVAVATPNSALISTIPNAGVNNRFSIYNGASRVFASAKMKYNLRKSRAVSDTSGSQVVSLMGVNSASKYTQVRFAEVDTALVLSINSSGAVTRIRPNENIVEASYDSIRNKWVKIDLDYIPNTNSVVSGENIYAANGLARLWVDGTEVINVANQQFITSPSVISTANNPYPSYVSLLRRMNPNLKGGAFGDSVYVDDIAVFSNPSRIEIGNASTYAACTIRNVCLHETWSPTTITLKLNMTGLTNQQATWLYIFDSVGNYITKQLRGGPLGEPARKTATIQYDGTGNLPSNWTTTSQPWTIAQYNLVGEHGMYITQANWLWDPFYTGNSHLADSLRVATRNPNIKIIGYVDPVSIYESYATGEDTLLTTMLWDRLSPFAAWDLTSDPFYRDATGDRRLVIDYSQPGAVTTFANLIYEFFTKSYNTNKGSGFGILLDNIMPTIRNGFISNSDQINLDIDRLGVGYFTDADDKLLWKNSMIALIDTLKAKMASGGYNDFTILTKGSAELVVDNNTTLLAKLDGVLLDGYPDYLVGTSPCPSDEDFAAAIGTLTTTAYDKPDVIRPLLSSSNGGPYILLANTKYSVNNLELLSLLSNTSNKTNWVVYTKRNAYQMASGSEFNTTYPYACDYVGLPTTPSSVDESDFGIHNVVTALRYFENGYISVETQPNTFSQTITTSCSPSTPVTILGANNPVPFKTYEIHANGNAIRSYTYTPPPVGLAINTISAPIVHGNSITITGTQFGLKTTPAPYIYDNMETGSFNSSWRTNYGTGNLIIDNAEHRSFRSLYSGRNNFQGLYQSQNDLAEIPYLGSTGFGKWGRFRTPDAFISDKLYAQYWFKLGSDWNWGTGIFANLGYVNLLNISAGGVENVTINTETSNIGLLTHVVGVADADSIFTTTTNFTLDTWHLLQFEYKESTVSLQDGSIKMWIDGSLVLNDNSIRTRITESGNKGIYSLGFKNNYYDTDTDNDTFYIDDAYVDNSWARIEIGNNSSYNSCTHREIQLPTAWSSGSITFTANLGSFSSTSGLYLFVIDSNGNVSPGFPIN